MNVERIVNPYECAQAGYIHEATWRLPTSVLDAKSIERMEGRLPDGLHARIASLECTTALDDWDDEHGEAILATQWQQVRRILMLVAEQIPLSPPVFVSASGDGYAHLTWTKPNGNRAVLEIGREHWWWSLLPIDSEGDSTEEAHGPDDVLARLADFTG